MKNTVLRSILVLFLGTILFSSCSTNTGCTDPKATNFESDADEDCNCCQYSGEMVFWYGETTANYLVANNVTSLVFYFDGQIAGSWAANLYYTSKPTCGQNGSITVTKKLGESKSKAFEYQVLDQDDNIVWEGVINIDANTCIKLELTP